MLTHVAFILPPLFYRYFAYLFCEMAVEHYPFGNATHCPSFFFFLPSTSFFPSRSWNSNPFRASIYIQWASSSTVNVNAGENRELFWLNLEKDYIIVSIVPSWSPVSTCSPQILWSCSVLGRVFFLASHRLGNLIYVDWQMMYVYCPVTGGL